MKELLHDDDVREEGRAEGREEGRIEGIQKGLSGVIAICRELGLSFEETQKRVCLQFELSEEAGRQAMEQYWK